MIALLSQTFFLAVLAFSIWTMVATIRPRMKRIVALLRYGPAGDVGIAPLPLVRGRQVRVRPGSAVRLARPQALRAVA